MLAPYRGAGIQKKTKKKQLSHAQRLRHEKGLQRAEAVQAQLDNKLEDAKSRLKRRQGRRALWDDVNDVSNEEVRKAIKAPGRFDTLDDDEDLSDNIQPFHGDTEIKVISGVQVPSFATGQSMNLSVGPTLAPSSKKPGTFGVSKAQVELEVENETAVNGQQSTTPPAASTIEPATTTAPSAVDEVPENGDDEIT